MGGGGGGRREVSKNIFKSRFQKFEAVLTSNFHSLTYSLFLFGVKCLVWGCVMRLVLGFFLNFQLLIVFLKIWVVLKRTFNVLQQWSSNAPIVGKCNGSSAAIVWSQLTAVEAGLAAVVVLAAL